MSVVVLGKNKICVETTKIMMENERIKIAGVVPCRDDSGKDSWQPSIKKFALDNDLPLYYFDNISSNKTLGALKRLDIDFMLSFQFDRILPERIINTARHGSTNLHFSPLPKSRGVSPIAWALYNGEDVYGVTLHYIDPGIDTGDIIGQVLFNIESVKSARELYDLCTTKGIELFRNSLDDVLDNRIKRVPQDHKDASCYPRGSFDFHDNIIDFNSTTRQLYNWCRAYIFPPFQHPLVKIGSSLQKILSAEPVYTRNRFEPPGKIAEKSGNSILVATNDCYIRLTTE